MGRQYRLQELAQHVGATPESLRRWIREDKLVSEVPRGNFTVPVEVCDHLLAHLHTDEARRRVVYRGDRVSSRGNRENELAEAMLKTPALKGMPREQVIRSLRGISQRFWNELVALVQQGYVPATMYLASPQLEAYFQGMVHGTVRSRVRKLMTLKKVRSTQVGRYQLYHMEDLKAEMARPQWREKEERKGPRRTPSRGEQLALPLQSVRMEPSPDGRIVLQLQVVLDADMLDRLRGASGR